jgi:CubicO group peptidase (beta-lactamase class C family)
MPSAPAESEPQPSSTSTGIDALVTTAGVQARTPGAVVLVARNGRVVFEKGYGLANIAAATPASASTQFYIASVSKAFTAMAIMMLAERGELSYEDPLTKFFPEFPRYAKRITVRHLLHHTSGIRDYAEFFDDSTARPGQTSPLLLEALAKQMTPLFAPGQRYEYSNSGYFLLAMIVDKVAGEPLPEFLRKNVFVPLGMKNSFVTAKRKGMWPDLATPYVRENGKYRDAHFGDKPIDLTYGDGGVVSTVGDLLKWDQALYTERLVKSTTLAEAFESGQLTNEEETGYGYGWEIDEFLGHTRIQHDGAWTGWNSVLVRYPDDRLTIIVLSSVEPFDPSDLAEQIARLYLEDESEDE